MSFSSPVVARSLSARLFVLLVYSALTLGALTVIVPLLAALSGATAGAHDTKGFSLFPAFLTDERVLWVRYIDAKYGGQIENLRMAWGRPDLDFQAIGDPPSPATASDSLRAWDELRAEHRRFSPLEAGLAFTRATRREAAVENRSFRRWLMAEFDQNLDQLSAALLVQARHATHLLPPVQSRLSRPDVDTAFNRKFEEYLVGVADSRRLLWNAGNFFRSVYLPRVYAGIGEYNQAFGTTYSSFDDVPFPARVPQVGGEAWFAFVQKVLNPAFVALTTGGQTALAASGLGLGEFLRLRAAPNEVKVVSIDTVFADWASARGYDDLRIPQEAIDGRAFHSESAFWRREFVTQNFTYVLDEVLIQGRGIRNTLVLVLLAIAGALTINPLAAYALSRYRMRQSYQVLLFFLVTIAFPAEVVMIPTFLQLKELGLLNTFGALVLPGLVNGFSIFLLKGFFDSLPKELYEAADLDGASEGQVFLHITMTLSKPILAVIALNAFVAAYGAFFFALIVAPDPKMWTLMVWIYQLRQSAGPGIVYASLLITAVPTLIVYLCAQNVILRGIVVPTEK